MVLRLQQGDITRMAVDAIVNAANGALAGGGGVDGAIHRRGGPAIMEACNIIRQQQGGCATGEAVITTAGNLPARYVIHTVGPIWQGGDAGEEDLLARCYRSSLRLCLEYDLRSVAFPNISTGVYRFPKRRAAEIAIAATAGFDAIDRIDEAIFVCFDDENHGIYEQLMPAN